jgi:RNA polymerase sigma-70 factor, ECF subfamily
VTLTIAEGLERHAVAVFDADLPLVNAVRNGDESAFEELLKRYDGKLYRVAQGIIHNHEDAEEVVQAAFLKAYLNLYRFQGNSKFSTWLIRIAMNESFMKLRKQRSNREQPLDTDNHFGSERSSHNRLDLTDWAANPESLYSATELQQILENCLQKLQPRLRVVFILRDIEGHSISETSGILTTHAYRGEDPPLSSKASIARRSNSILQEVTLK